jgi:drug/metabolite transporter (DMT)-like permease
VPSPAPRFLLPVLASAVVAMSLSAIFIRQADAPGLVIALWRLLLASLLLLPFTIRALKRSKLTRGALGYTVLAGLMLAGHFATWITSLEYTSVAASVSFVTTNPLWVALFTWLFLGQRPALTVIFGVLLAVAGGSLIGFDSSTGSASALGNGLAVAGAIFASAYLLLGRAAQRRGMTVTAYAGSAYLVAAVALLPLPALAGQSYTAYGLPTFGWIVLLAVVPQLIGHTGINYALRFLSPTLVASIMLLEPVGASLLALLIFGELPGILTLSGAAVLLGGVLLTNRFSQRIPPAGTSSDIRKAR